MSFLSKTIEATKKSQSNRSEYDRISGVLYNIIERRVKKHILSRASSGYTDASIDLLNDCSIDISSRWSISELLFDTVFEDTATVSYKLFFEDMSPFIGFDITNNSPVFLFDWTHAMLHETPNVVPALPPPNAPIKRKLFDNEELPIFSQDEIKRKLFGNVELPVFSQDEIKRNLFGNGELPIFSQDEIVAYLASLMPQIPAYP